MIENMMREEIDYLASWLPVKIMEIVHDASPRCPDGWNRWHRHEEAEFLAVLEGAMKVETVGGGSRELTPGSVLVLGSLEPHRTYKKGHVRYIVLQLHLMAMLDAAPHLYSSALSEHPLPLSRHNAIYADDAVRRESFALIQAIYEEVSRRRTGFELAVSGYARLLLLHLVRHGSGDSISETNRMREVLDYVEGHLADPIRIRDVLPLVNVSYHHFLKSFKRCVGMSFIAYVHERRIRKAEKLLLTEDWSNEDIGLQCGFSTPAQFYNVFKRVNRCSPREFRKRMTAQSHSQ